MDMHIIVEQNKFSLSLHIMNSLCILVIMLPLSTAMEKKNFLSWREQNYWAWNEWYPQIFNPVHHKI